MKIYIGADHAGFYLKERLHAYLVKKGYDVEDEGNKQLDQTDDYPQFAYAVTTKILGSEDSDPRGILLCGSGQGMAMAANRVRGIRASVIWDEHEARTTRLDNNSNVLCLPARVVGDNTDEAFRIVETWLTTDFSRAPRHQRRLDEIEQLYG